MADVGLLEADDSRIWEYAVENQAVLVTKDEDFPHRLRQGGTAPVILWLRLGNTIRRALLQWFEPLLPQIMEMIGQGEGLIEIR